MLFYYVYVMDKLYQGIQQRNESSVVCDMLGQEWIRHWKQGCLAETMWFWICDTIVVHVMLCACRCWICQDCNMQCQDFNIPCQDFNIYVMPEL